MAPLKETDKNKNGAQLFAINRYERKVKFVWKKKTTKTKKNYYKKFGEEKDSESEFEIEKEIFKL